MREAVILFTKTPVFNQVKKRLTPLLKPELIYILYGCFIKDMISKLRRLKGVDLFVSYTPEGSGRYFEDIIQKSRIFAQEGSNLGERIFNSFKFVFLKGYRGVCFIAGDSPDLPVKYIENAFKYLRQKRKIIVSGPCLDGGCYLLGINAVDLAGLARDIPWKQKDSFKTIINISKIRGISFHSLPRWYDIDKPEGIVKLLKSMVINKPKDIIYTRRFFLQLGKNFIPKKELLSQYAV